MALDLDDEQLWVEQAQRDRQAFTRLYDCYFPRLYAYVSYRVGRVQDTEDLVAETFLKAVEGIKRFEWRHEGSFAAWLFRIAHNLLTDRYRQPRYSEPTIPLEDLPQLRANNLLPDEIVLQKEKFAQLRAALASLAPRRREVITLKFFGGLRNREIAIVLGLDERTIASHLQRGLQDLNRKFGLELLD